MELDGGRLGVIIGDATGKGVPAALVMAAARSYVRTAALEVSSPGLVLSKANEFLCQGMPANMFVTCLYAVIDLQNGSILFANAGHHLPCHLMPGEVNELMARGMPLGLMPGMEYEEGQANISPGESVLFYSDGLVEAHNASREMFGIPRLKRLLNEMQIDSPVVSNILKQWYAFLGDDREQEDDMTLVVLQRIAKDKSLVPSDGGISVAIKSLPELAEQPWAWTSE
jgi:serine phosphatase RsbU (regulator of sigma subunit)